MANPHNKAKDTGKCTVWTLSERFKNIKAVEDSPLKSPTQMSIKFVFPLPTLSTIIKDTNKYLGQAKSGDITVVTTGRKRTVCVKELFYFACALHYPPLRACVSARACVWMCTCMHVCACVCVSVFVARLYSVFRPQPLCAFGCVPALNRIN